MSDQIVKTLFNELKSEDIKTKYWVGKAIAGIIIVDEYIHPNERGYLLDVIDNFLEDKDFMSEFLQIIHDKRLPHLEKLSLPEETQTKIFECLLDISGKDDDLHHMELQFLAQIGFRLDMESVLIHYLIDTKILDLHSTSLTQLMTKLDDLQKVWLSIATLKLVMADGVVNDTEFMFFSKLLELNDNMTFMEQVQKDEVNLQLPNVKFSQDMTQHIMRYLLTIAVIDQDFDPNERKLITEIAESIKFDVTELDSMIQSVMVSLNFS